MGLGLVTVDLEVANAADLERRATVTCLVDSDPGRARHRPAVGAYVPACGRWKDLRRMGDAMFFLDGRQGASPVVFGAAGDATLLGTVTLEALGLMLDPIRRRLRPLPLTV